MEKSKTIALPILISDIEIDTMYRSAKEASVQYKIDMANLAANKKSNENLQDPHIYCERVTTIEEYTEDLLDKMSEQNTVIIISEGKEIKRVEAQYKKPKTIKSKK